MISITLAILQVLTLSAGSAVGSSPLSLHLHTGEAEVRVEEVPKNRITRTTVDEVRVWKKISKNPNKSSSDTTRRYWCLFVLL